MRTPEVLYFADVFIQTNDKFMFENLKYFFGKPMQEMIRKNLTESIKRVKILDLFENKMIPFPNEVN